MNTASPEGIRQALLQLSEEQQRILALRFGCGLAIPEVARTMGTSEAAARRLEAGAVARLTRCLGPRRIA